MKKKIIFEISEKQNNWIDALMQQNKVETIEAYMKDLIDKDISLNDKWVNFYDTIEKRIENKGNSEDLIDNNL